MSSEAMGWTFRHSPYKGGELLVHLAIADSVNDMHAHRFWMSMGNLAAKARVSRQWAKATVHKMEEQGFLVCHKRNSHRPSLYEFMFPETVVVFDTRGGKSVTVDEEVASEFPAGGNSVASEVATQSSKGGNSVATNPIEPKTSTQDERKSLASTSASLTAGFDDFYSVYPRKKARGDAFKAWQQMRRKGYSAAQMITAARDFAADPNLPIDKTVIPYPATWLRAEQFLDGPLDAPVKQRRQWAQSPVDARYEQLQEAASNGRGNHFAPAPADDQGGSGRVRDDAVRELPDGSSS